MHAFSYIFDIEHILTPYAFEKRKVALKSGTRYIALIYIFGIRVAYFNVS